MTTEAQNEQTESTTDMDKVIARIQKILSRTNTASGTTEAEADTALKMAQELALRHNLDLAQIEASAAQSNASAPVERVKDVVQGRAMYKWQRQLAKYIAEANFCYHLIQERSEWVKGYYKLHKETVADYGFNAKDFKGQLTNDEYWDLTDSRHRNCYTTVEGRYKTIHKHIFVGRKGNVITAQMMFQYLTQTIEDLVPVANNAQRLSRSAMSWKEGCGDRLCERLAARRKDLIEKHDARVKQEEADRKADREASHAAKVAATPKPLPAHHESEVKAGMDAIASDAYDASGPVPEAEEQDRPEADEDEEPWTPEGDVVAEPEAGTALVLASVFDESEREANYELAQGLEPGTCARWRREREERQRLEAEAAAKEELDEVEAPVKQETERQRVAREKREAAEHAKNRRRWAREDAAAARKEQREWDRRDHRAYNAGAEKGKSIGLDTQIKGGKDPKKLG